MAESSNAGFRSISPRFPRVAPISHKSFGVLSNIEESGFSLRSITPYTPKLYGQLGVSSYAAFAVDGLDDKRPNVSCPGDISFGEVNVESQKIYTLTIKNIGNAIWTLDDVYVLGDGFVLTQGPKPILNPGEITNLKVTFTPLEDKVYNGTLTIKSNSTVAACTTPLTGTGSGVILTYYSWQGAFQWYGFYPYDYNPNDTPLDVPERYLNKAVSGQNKIIYSFSGYPDGSNTSGRVTNNLSGSYSISPVNGVQTGTLLNQVVYDPGAVCAGSSYAYIPASGLTQVFNGDGIDSLLGHGQSFVSGKTTSHLIRTYTSAPYKGPSYYVSYCGAGYNGEQASATEVLSIQMTTEQAAAAGGALIIVPDVYTDITTYNSGTGISTGVGTRVRIQSPHASLTGKFLIDITLTEEPSGGGSITSTKVVSIFRDVGIGAHLDYYYDLPQKIGKRIRVQNVKIYDIDVSQDDFDRLPSNGSYYGTAPSWFSNSDWSSDPEFGMQQPATESVSDWSDGLLLNTPGVDFQTDVSGYYWNAALLFNGTDYTQTNDDFENYPVGTILTLGKGIGWSAVGRFNVFDYNIVYDDFESYSVGVITFLNFSTGNPLNPWGADGAFMIFDYTLAQDDLESYSVGTITTLNGGSGWSANGGFRLFP